MLRSTKLDILGKKPAALDIDNDRGINRIDAHAHGGRTAGKPCDSLPRMKIGVNVVDCLCLEGTVGRTILCADGAVKDCGLHIAVNVVDYNRPACGSTGAD